MFFMSPFIESHSLMGGGSSAKQIYFYSTSTLMLLWLGYDLAIRREKLSVIINGLDIMIILFWLWSLIRFIFSYDALFLNEKIIELTLLLLFYFVLKIIICGSADKTSFDFRKCSIIAFLCCGLVQAVFGILQNIGYRSPHSVYNILGTFENPNFYAEYLAIIVSFALGVFVFIPGNDKKNRSLRYIGLATFLVGIFILPATRCRSSWLAVITSVFFIATIKWNIIVKLMSVLRKKIIMIVCGAGFIALLAVFVYSIYIIKPDSAGGRLFIWKISLHMIAKNPLVGIGFDKFKVEYENYQADYFASGAGSLYEEKVAGHVLNAYNEPLQICAELGIIGLFIFIAIIGVAFFSLKKQKSNENPFLFSALASILAFVVDSWFAYPMSILPLYFCFFFLLSVVSASRLPQSDISFFIPVYGQKIFAMCFLALAALIGWHTITLQAGYRSWQSASQSTMRNDLTNAVDNYQKLYPLFKNNGKFLFMYGDVLQRVQKHNEVIPLLENAKMTFNDPNLWITLGQSYEALEKYEKAEEHYIKAANIKPNYFLPKYLQIKLLMRIGKTDDAIALGQKFIVKEEKIPSPEVQEMKAEIDKLINTKQTFKRGVTFQSPLDR